MIQKKFFIDQGFARLSISEEKSSASSSFSKNVNNNNIGVLAGGGGGSGSGDDHDLEEIEKETQRKIDYELQFKENRKQMAAIIGGINETLDDLRYELEE